MSLPTLGYEEDTKTSKTEIARVQLTEAICLFMQKKFLCALTIAGAAEEILSKLLNSRGINSTVEESFDAIQKIRQFTGLAVMGNKPKNEIFNIWNTGRNTVKHHNTRESEVVVINLFDEAYWMIKRALDNASRLEISIQNELDFENWCIEQIHL